MPEDWGELEVSNLIGLDKAHWQDVEQTINDFRAEIEKLRHLLYGWASWHTGTKPHPDMAAIVSETHAVLGWGVGTVEEATDETV